MEACSAHPDLLAVPLSETSLKDSLSQIPLITTWQSLTSLSQRDLESSSSTDTSLHSSSCPGSSSPTLLLSCGSILPSAWIHGDPTEPLFQAHEVNPGYWVIRFSKRLDYEGNFVFFIIGKDRAILFDTGPVESSILPTIILPTLFSLTTQTDYGVDARWRKDRSERENNFHEEYERFEWKGKSLTDFDLIVAHTHSHGDHVAGDAQWERLLLAREQSTLHSNCVNTAFKNDCAISTTRNEDWIPMVKAWKSISFIKHSVDSIVEFSGMRLCSFTDSGVSSPQSHSLSNPPLHSSSPLPLDPSWPISHAGEINLGGGRVLTLLPTPGHCRDHVVIYDPISRHLITGDHIYPGRLYVRDYQAFQRSVIQIANYLRYLSSSPQTNANESRGEYVFGCHIEMTSALGEDYGTGCAFQPDEADYGMTREDIFHLERELSARNSLSKKGHIQERFPVINGRAIMWPLPYSCHVPPTGPQDPPLDDIYFSSSCPFHHGT